MKNAFILAVVALATIFFGSCKKCYTCHNQCEVCQKMRHDTTLTVLIESQNFTAQYYQPYIDSLTLPTVGWTCKDTTSNYQQQYCGNSNGDLLNEEAKGYTCN
jgi:hypothetical protein